jgi:4-diphosphocytidyl-2-C-methyl-D-erythritol kinase
VKRDPSGFAVAAPAKINLHLHVTGRRADGYHLLDSSMAFTAVGDRVFAAPAAELSLAIDGPFATGLSAGEDNLVMRAARVLAERTGARAGAAIRLVKNLPIASGIGGGSSDAAATLRALAALWRLGPRALADSAWTADRLGADVPVCLFAAPARVSGIGEVIEAAPDLPPCAVVLVNPGLAVATAQVFARREGAFSPPAPRGRAATDARELAAQLSGSRNDLAPAAISLAPRIADVLEALRHAHGCRLARMSGSGATCFGLFDRDGEATAAARTIAGRRPEWWVRATWFRSAAPRVRAFRASGPSIGPPA